MGRKRGKSAGELGSLGEKGMGPLEAWGKSRGKLGTTQRERGSLGILKPTG